MTGNPFFETWDTPFGIPPFDRIRPGHFPPAFDRGMAEQLAEIAAVAGAPWPPSFADTVEALERSGQLLDRVSRVFSNLDASDTNPALEAIARDFAPKRAQHQMRIALDSRLFARIADLYARRAELGLGRGPAASSRTPPSALCAQRRAARPRPTGAHGGARRAAGDVAHLVRPERVARRARMAAGARRGRSRRPARFCLHRRGARGRRARPRRALRRQPRALVDRAVSDLFGPPRFAPHRARGVDCARNPSGGGRQHALDPRDHGVARRAGKAPRLR